MIEIMFVESSCESFGAYLVGIVLFMIRFVSFSFKGNLLKVNRFKTSVCSITFSKYFQVTFFLSKHEMFQNNH